MELAAIIEIIMTQATIWAPSLVAVLGVVATLIPAYSKIKSALSEVKETNAEIKKTEEFEKLHADLRQAHLDNKALREQMSLVIDKCVGITNYEKVGMTHERENEETEN